MTFFTSMSGIDQLKRIRSKRFFPKSYALSGTAAVCRVSPKSRARFRGGCDGNAGLIEPVYVPAEFREVHGL